MKFQCLETAPVKRACLLCVLAWIHHEMNLTFQIYDGPNTGSTLLQTLCGTTTIPADIQSSSNQMHVTFVSDLSITKTGFYASFIAGMYTFLYQSCVIN